MPDGITGSPLFVDDPYLRLRQVELEVGLSRSAIYRRIKAGSFPAPQPIGGGIVRWPLSVIRGWKRGDPLPDPTPEPVAVLPCESSEAAPEPRRRGRPRKA